jgi:hypothetical protein
MKLKKSGRIMKAIQNAWQGEIDLDGPENNNNNQYNK